jgi:hypothetical protein
MEEISDQQRYATVGGLLHLRYLGEDDRERQV